MAETDSTAPIKDTRDAYGDLVENTDDHEALSSAVTGILIEHPIVLKNFPYCGSAVYAKLVDALFGEAGETHPKSEFAMRMSAIADGIATAVVYRLRDHFGWDDDQESEVDDLLRNRRRKGVCVDCKAETRRPRYWWCDRCDEKLRKQIAEESDE